MLSENKLIMADKGKELSGDYWGAILDLFRDTRGTYLLVGGSVGMNDRDALKSLLAECKNKIVDIEEAEHDRLLANTESEANIRYGKRGYIMSIIALAISVLALALEIVKWLQG